MPPPQVVAVLSVPQLDFFRVVPRSGYPNGERLAANIHRVTCKAKLWIRLVQNGQDAVRPKIDVDIPPIQAAPHTVLDPQCRGIGVVAVASILTGAVGPDEPTSFFPDFELVLVKLNVPEAEAVVPLVHCRPLAHVEPVDQLRAFVSLLRLESPMATPAELQVVGVVIHQIDLFVPCAENPAQTAQFIGHVRGKIHVSNVFISVDVDSVKASGIGAICGRSIVEGKTINWTVIRGLPIVGREGKRVDFVGKKRIAFFVFKGLRPTETPLAQVPFPHAVGCAESLEHEWILRLHVDHPVEGARTVIRRTRTSHNFDGLDIQIRRTQEIPQREIESRALVVHPVDQLQRAHRRRAVESSCVHNFETQRG